jgi:hypothetical protein
MAPVSDRKSPVERALYLIVYAPVGLAALAREELPKIIERGHQELNNQATVAKMMGEYAVAEGRKEAGKALQQAGDAMGNLRSLAERRMDGRRPASPPASATAASPPAPPAPRAPLPPPPAPPAPPVVAPAPPLVDVSTPPAGPAPTGDGLAIPGYDALSASQVVQRLAGLSGPELEDVRAYESATRGRKTILNRVEQLRTAPSSS